MASSGLRSRGSSRRSGPLALLASIYDLDTLDTRFTTPSSVPYKAAIDSRPRSGSDGSKADKRGAERPKWHTPEYYLYYLLLSFIIPSMFWIAYGVSRRMFKS